MQVMLTTKDNPYDPFTQWDDWYAFDEEQGYCTSGYLARIVKTSDELSDKDQFDATVEAIDEIIELNPDGFYIKLIKKD